MKQAVQAKKLETSREKLQRDYLNPQAKVSKAGIKAVSEDARQSSQVSKAEYTKLEVAQQLCNYAELGIPCRKSNCHLSHNVVVTHDGNVPSSKQSAEGKQNLKKKNPIATKTRRRPLKVDAHAEESSSAKTTHKLSKGTASETSTMPHTRSNESGPSKPLLQSSKKIPINPKIRGKSTTPCRDFVKGHCERGENCAFSHVRIIKAKDQGGSTFANSHSTAQVPSKKPASMSPVIESPSTPPARLDKETSIEEGSSDGTLMKSSVIAQPEPLEVSHPGEVPKTFRKKSKARKRVNLFTGPTEAVAKPPEFVKPAYSDVVKLSSPTAPASNMNVNRNSQGNVGHSAPPRIFDSTELLVSGGYQVAPATAVIDPTVKVTNLGFSQWDHTGMLYWMNRNLSSELKARLHREYRPYLEKGVIPLSALKTKIQFSKTLFPQFSQLPYDIRLIIWQFALRKSCQEVHVEVISRVLADGTPFSAIEVISKLPRLMRVSKETSIISKKFYELAFSTRTRAEARTWINFANDCLVLHLSAPSQLLGLSESMKKRDALRLKYLTIPICYWIGKPDAYKEEILKALSIFKNLKVLYIMAGDSEEDKLITKDVEIIYAMEWLVRHKFEEVYGKGARVPKIEKQVIPALQAKHWGIDGLKYEGAERNARQVEWDGAFPKQRMLNGCR